MSRFSSFLLTLYFFLKGSYFNKCLVIVFLFLQESESDSFKIKVHTSEENAGKLREELFNCYSILLIIIMSLKSIKMGNCIIA